MRDGIAVSITRGDRRAALVAISEHLEAALLTAEGSQIAAISRELRAVMTELDALPGGKEVSAVDEFSARLAKRRADATGS